MQNTTKDRAFKIIGTLAVVSVLIIGGAYAISNYQQDKGPEQIVKRFYSEWIDYQGSPIVDKFYQNHELLTVRVENEIDEIIASFDKGGAYDPVLCAQDKPSNFTTEIATLNDKTSSIIVHEAFRESESDVVVYLEKRDGRWLIDDIICKTGDDSDSYTKEDIEAARQFLKDNIGQYSPVEPVLGGSWHVTDVELSGTRALVWYEDGHIARKALVDFNYGGQEDIIEINFAIPAYLDERDLIEIETDKQFAVILESNPTTGYKWTQGTEEGVVGLIGEGFIPSDQENSVGVGGYEYFIYEGILQGEDNIVLMYSRPWESVQPAETKTFRVLVE